MRYFIMLSLLALSACGSYYDGHYGPNYYADHNDDYRGSVHK